MLDLLLIGSLGFLGSFGHCASMCGPLVAAFALSAEPVDQPQPLFLTRSSLNLLVFHGLLNLGRIFSYAATGAAIGAIGSVLIAGGQLAGVGSVLRQLITLLTGLLLIWLGLVQIRPQWLPKLPILHPLLQAGLHQRLSQRMVQLSMQRHWWTPFWLGAIWGLIPCGFLYTAQIKAAETGSLWLGAGTMLAFGLGTLPTLFGVGVSTTLLSADRRSQLFRLGGWVTLTVGVLTLLRTGNTMADYTGHAALFCLGLALIARPLGRIWPAPLRYRRALGVGAFVLSLAHTLHMVEHAWGWNFRALLFMLPQHQWGIAAGAGALLFMLPAALTSFNWAQQHLKLWRRLHLLAVPALLLAVMHCVLIGSNFLGSWQTSAWNWLWVGLLSSSTIGLLLLRVRWFWALLGLEKFYLPPAAQNGSQPPSA
ncbi:MAG: sulfite exporter TauE/SafE family protein [Elainella sp.]